MSDQTKNGLNRYDINVRDSVYIILMILSSVLLSAIGIFGGFHGGFTVTAIILSLVLTLYLLGKGYKFKLFPIVCLVLSVGVSLSFLITSNGAVKFWSFVAYLALTATWYVSTVRSEISGNTGFICHIFSPVAEMFSNIPAMFVSVFSGKKGKNKTLITVLIGIAVALPVMVIVIPLLMNSDEAFSGMVSAIFSDLASIIFRSIFGSVIAIFVVSYALSLKKDKPLIEKGFSLEAIDPVIIVSFLSVISVCYLSYLFSQLAYFFDAFRGFLPDGYEFTVATYARRGFFEMTIIATINFIVIVLCRMLAKKQNKKLLLAVNILSTFIGAFTLIIISTAMSKMIMYISVFGMTRRRIMTSMFMIFLAVVFIVLLLGLYIKKINVIKAAFVTAAVILITLGCANINRFIADYNYNAYKSDILDTMDVKTIAELGDEGVPYLVALTDDSNAEVAHKAKYMLSHAYDDYFYFDYDEHGKMESYERIYDEIGEMSISRETAYDELEKYLNTDADILDYKYDYNKSNSYN